MAGRLPPLFALALAGLAAAMLVPSGYAALVEDWRAGRAFLFSGIATGFAAAIMGVALAGPKRLPEGQGELATLLAVWMFLPVFAALPLRILTPQIGFAGAWFEMVAAFTTTGGTVYAEPERLPMAVHLWRGLVGWLGGLVTLTAAYAILAPRRLGGFEVMRQVEARPVSGDLGSRLDLGAGVAPVENRIIRAVRSIFPIYAGLTIALTLVFATLGGNELAGAIHAMAILSTSGISPYATGLAARPDFWAEVAAAIFMIAASTRLVYARASVVGTRNPVTQDQELLLMAALVATATLALFLRHWLGALTVAVPGREGLGEALTALWGSLFTTLSFLTTTGFESGYWERARGWSGLSNPALILLGLCAIGGGAATTAGGIKLVRAVALLRHGTREIERLALPNVILGAGSGMRGMLRQGAFIAWAFVMLFVFAVFALMLALAIAGMSFEHGLIAALAAMTNTGPVYTAVLGPGASFGLLGLSERAILALGMILGRVETLMVLAIFSPDAWRALRRRKKTSGKRKGQPSQSGR